MLFRDFLCMIVIVCRSPFNSNLGIYRWLFFHLRSFCRQVLVGVRHELLVISSTFVHRKKESKKNNISWSPQLSNGSNPNEPVEHEDVHMFALLCSIKRATWREKENCCTHAALPILYVAAYPHLSRVIFFMVCSRYALFNMMSASLTRTLHSHLHANFILSLTMNDGPDIGLTTYQPIRIRTIITSDRRQAVFIWRPAVLRSPNVAYVTRIERNWRKKPEIYWLSNRAYGEGSIISGMYLSLSFFSPSVDLFSSLHSLLCLRITFSCFLSSAQWILSFLLLTHAKPWK